MRVFGSFGLVYQLSDSMYAYVTAGFYSHLEFRLEPISSIYSNFGVFLFYIFLHHIIYPDIIGILVYL